MGVDWLDISFRLEKEFGICMRAGDLERVLPDAVVPGRTGIRCRDVHRLVVAIAAEQEVVLPPSSWTRVKRCIMKGCGAKAVKVRPDAWLVDDVGCC